MYPALREKKTESTFQILLQASASRAPVFRLIRMSLKSTCENSPDVGHHHQIIKNSLTVSLKRRNTMKYPRQFNVICSRRISGVVQNTKGYKRGISTCQLVQISANPNHDDEQHLAGCFPTDLWQMHIMQGSFLSNWSAHIGQIFTP